MFVKLTSHMSIVQKNYHTGTQYSVMRIIWINNRKTIRIVVLNRNASNMPTVMSGKTIRGIQILPTSALLTPEITSIVKRAINASVSFFTSFEFFILKILTIENIKSTKRGTPKNWKKSNGL